MCPCPWVWCLSYQLQLSPGPPAFGIVTPNETNVALERETEALHPWGSRAGSAGGVCESSAVLPTGSVWEAREGASEQDADPATRSRDGSGHSAAQGSCKKVMVARVVGEEFINKPADGFIYKHPHHHPEPSLGLAPFCTWRCTTLGCPWTTSQGRCQCWYWGTLLMPGHCCPCGTNPPLGTTSSGPEVSLWSHRMSSSTWGLLENTAGLLRWLRMKHMFAYRLDACPSKSWDDQKRGMSISTANALIYCVPENMGRLS